MTARKARYRRLPKGAWMKLRSGKLLAGQMDARNISQYQLAHLAGCSRAFISHLVSGRKTTCTGELGERISGVLGVDPELLFVVSLPPVGRIVAPEQRKTLAGAR